MKKIPLHIKIILGMFIGVVFGALVVGIGSPDKSVLDTNKETAKRYKNELKSIEAEIKTIENSFTSDQNLNIASLGKLKKLELQREVTKSNYSKAQKLAFQQSKGQIFIERWIKPWGTIFINLLKLIAIPLIIASLIKGVSDLKDISKFAKIGGRSILIYIGTTVVAITIGLVIVNLVKPGGGISQETIEQLTSTYDGNTSISSKLSEATNQQSAGPLQFIVDMVPSNIFSSLSNNGSMLQVIFFAIFFLINGVDL